jgi:beta-glucosidase
LGLNSYRFSIEWAKIEPKPGEWNEGAIDWYRALIEGCEKRGLVPMLTLHHFTSPQWFAESGGFSNPHATHHFLRFVKKVVDRLGAHVPLWCTFNEPGVLISGGYLGAFMPPAKFDPRAASRASAVILDCHAQAYDLIHGNQGTRAGPWAHWPVRVGIAHNMLDFRADRLWNLLEWGLSWAISRYYNHDWLRAVTGQRATFGVPFFIPSAPPVASALGRKTVDFIGVNYYTKAYVQWRPKQASHPRPNQSPVGIHFAKRNEVASDLDWAIHPSGFRKILRTASRYGLPIYVTENGIADRYDSHRGLYLRRHIAEIAKARAEGANILGYYHWSLIDNFEWIKGFGPRFGLIEIDYETFERKPRPSAEIYQRMIRAHRGSEAPNLEAIEKLLQTD